MPPYGDLGGLYRFHARLLGLLAQGLDDADWRHRAGGNSALWLLAHITTCKLGLLRALGEARDGQPWEAGVVRGGSPDAELPDAQILLPCWQAANETLVARLDTLSEEQAARPSPRSMPDGGATLGAMARFLHFHEAYHLGQLGMLRRQRGKSGVI
jgi:uncharacterized damage-inducible protein DinB